MLRRQAKQAEMERPVTVWSPASEKCIVKHSGGSLRPTTVWSTYPQLCKLIYTAIALVNFKPAQMVVFNLAPTVVSAESQTAALAGFPIARIGALLGWLGVRCWVT